MRLFCSTVEQYTRDMPKPTVQLQHIFWIPGSHPEDLGVRYVSWGEKVWLPRAGEPRLLRCHSECGGEFVFTLLTPEEYAQSRREVREKWLKRSDIVVITMVTGMLLASVEISWVLQVAGMSLAIPSAILLAAFLLVAARGKAAAYTLVRAEGSSELQPKWGSQYHEAVVVR